MSLPYIAPADGPALNCTEPTDNRYLDDELLSIRAHHRHTCPASVWMDKEIARRGLRSTP